jgi:beta-lactamase class A
VPGTGVLKDLAPGLRLSLGDAATLMVTMSDNVATNLVIDRLGTRAINGGIREAGYRETRLGGKLFRRHRGSSSTTAEELGQLMLSIARGEAVSGAASAAMLGILRREQYDHIVGRYLPFSPGDVDGSAPRWRVASKNGSLVGVRNDVAHVEGDGVSYVVALVSRDCADPRFCLDNEATVCLAQLARLVHDWCAGARR